MLKEIDRLLSSRTFLKVISLLMAIAIWYYVASDRTSETVRTFSFPIEYLNAPAEYAINSNIRSVEVQVAASRELFLGESWSGIACQADLKGLGPGKHIVPVKVILPSGFKLINISPVSIEVNIIKTQSKDVPVRLKLLGELPPEYTLEEVEMEPEKITIKGPEDIINSISEAYVEASFEMLKDRNTLVLPVRVKSATEGSSELLMEPPKVKVNYVLTKGTPKKTVPISVNIEGKLDQDYDIKSITVEPGTGVVEGSMDAIRAIREIVVPVNVEGL
ncbi:MAG: YbbR family protein, partial [Thermovirga lienii]